MRHNIILIIVLLCSIVKSHSQIPLTEHKSFKEGLKKVKIIPSKKKNTISIPKEEKAIKETKNEETQIDTTLLSKNMYQKIDNLNVKDVELRDILRGIAYQYKVNLVVQNDLKQPVTLSLMDVSVLDCIVFLCNEYNLDIIQKGNIIKILSRKSEQTPEPSTADKFIITIKNGNISLDIKQIDLSVIMKEISQKSGLNFVIKHGVQVEISGFFQDIELLKGIQLLLQNNNLSLREHEGIYYVDYDRKTYSGVDGKEGSLWVTVSKDSLVSFDVIDAEIMQVIRELSQQLDINLVTYDTPKGKISAKCSNIKLPDALNILFKGTEFTYKKEDNIYIIGNKKISGLTTAKLIRLKHIRSEGIPELLPETLKRHATIKIIKEQNAIMVIATSDVISNLEEFLVQIDHPTPQILIEALVVDFSSSDIKELGVMLGSNKAHVDTSGWNNFSLLDVGFNENGKFYSQHDGPSMNQQLSKISNWAGIRNIGVLPDNFYMKIQALESEGKANVRSRPQIATLNGHTASISIGTTQYYILKTTTPVTSAENLVTQESERFEKVEANVTLAITPWVSASGEVTTEIHPEFKTPVGSFNSDIPPTINSRIIDSTVRLNDGETIILGGLIEEKNTKTYRKIPILGDIPLLKYLFRTRTKDQSKTEMMIYITPHVFYGNEFDSEKWQQLKQKYE